MAKKKQSNYTYDDIQEFPFAKVKLNKSGQERREYHKKLVWELVVSDFLKKIDPKDYFCTTGDAVIKARKLEHDLFKAAGVARKLANTLENKLRADNVYMETQWQNGRLLVKAKNPRKNKEEKAQALKENFLYGNKSKSTPAAAPVTETETITSGDQNPPEVCGSSVPVTSPEQSA